MSKESGKFTDLDPNIRKGMEIAQNIKDIKQDLKDDADRRKIDGFNPGDLEYRK